MQPIGKAHLHETGPDTLMGRLLRRFWHPIALSSDVAPGAAAPVRGMCEDLTLYRGQSGAPHLVGGACAHRCSVLHTGDVQGDEIACMYHGWRFDADGQCTLIPAEAQPRRHMPRIVAYPVHEYCGLIFAWLGPLPAPPFALPRKDVMEDPKRHVIPKREVWDCNWFQQVENSMDAVHLSFAHMWGVKGQFGMMVSGAGELPELSYEETDSGMRQTARRSNGNVRVSDWTFPDNNHILAPGPTKSSPWGHVSVWATPIDDTRTMRYRLFSLAGVTPEELEKVKRDQIYDPGEHYDALFKGDLAGLPAQGLVSAQDYVAVRGQGVIVDREAENLSTSDAGIIFLRKIFYRELEAIRDGRPIKAWARLADKVDLKQPPALDAAKAAEMVV
jgi:5,5'-dehydrodivanillate O-demethylase